MVEPRAVPFERNEFLRFIPQKRLRAIDLELVTRTFHCGEVVFEAGDAGDACYLLEYGSIRISVEGGGGKHETVAILGPGDFFGELALYDNAARSARATALEETRLGRLDRHVFERLREIAPLEVAAALTEANIERVRNTNATLINELAAAGRLRAIGSELSTIAHNLRGPLATVQNAAEVLRDLLDSEDTPREQVVKFVEIIHRTAHRALRSTDELLAQLRGEREAEWAVLSVTEIVAGAEQQVRGLLNGSSIALSTEVRTDLSVRVHATELEAALANLVRNAVEALPAEGGEVRISAEEEGPNLVFTVTDTGCGIPPEHRGRIFEPRFTSGKAGGTGLGLSHVKDVAEEHHGRIELAATDPGRGTTFRMYIPASG